MSPQATTLPQSDPIGHITVVYGTATVQSGGEARPLAQGDPVYRGEDIFTGPESSVEITFQDDTVLSQSQNSHVNLDRYVFDPDTGAGDVLLKLTQGAFRMATGAIVETNPDKFRVQSPLATIGIRGTSTGHVVPGEGSNQPENHSCLDYEGHPVVVQSNLGGPAQTLFGAGIGVPASPFGLGSIGALSGQQMAFFNTMSPGAMAQGAPSFSPPPEFSTPPLPGGDDGGEDAPTGDDLPGDDQGDAGDQSGDQDGGQDGGSDAGGDPAEGLQPGTGLGMNAHGVMGAVPAGLAGPVGGDGQGDQGRRRNSLRPTAAMAETAATATMAEIPTSSTRNSRNSRTSSRPWPASPERRRPLRRPAASTRPAGPPVRAGRPLTGARATIP